MSIPDPEFLTLAQVAARTGRHPELLRQWCASGRLPCLRLGGSWVLRESDLMLVDGMERRCRSGNPTRRRSADTGRQRVIAAAFADTTAAGAAEAEARSALGDHGVAIETGPIQLPGTPPLALTVVAARLPGRRAREARALLASFGGRIVADLDAASDDQSGAPNTSAAFSPPKPNEVESTRR